MKLNSKQKQIIRLRTLKNYGEYYGSCGFCWTVVTFKKIEKIIGDSKNLYNFVFFNFVLLILFLQLQHENCVLFLYILIFIFEIFVCFCFLVMSKEGHQNNEAQKTQNYFYIIFLLAFIIYNNSSL
jgi:hypothetical protein